MEELKVIIAENIQNYRTNLGLTQIELAEKLNYSDKSVSKWERGFAIPDVIVLKNMADLFGITVDELLTKHEGIANIIIPEQKKANRLLISLLACGLVWLVATLIYVVLLLFRVSGSWRCFVYAIPATMVVATVFSTLWGKMWCTCIAVSLLIWTALLSIYITFLGTRAWLWFLIGIPLQVLTILWFALMMVRKRNKNT